MGAGKKPLLFVIMVASVVLLAGGALYLAMGAGTAGAVMFIHADAPVNIPLNAQVEVKVTLYDQQGQPVTGRAYGDPLTPGTWYIEEVRSINGNAASFTVTSPQELGNGLYRVLLTITSWPAGETSDLYTIKVGYTGTSAAPENASSTSYRLATTVSFRGVASGGGTAGKGRYFVLQPDKVAVKAADSTYVTVKAKITDQTGKAVTGVPAGGFTFTGAITNSGANVAGGLSSVTELGYGVYSIKLKLNTAGLAADTLIKVGLRAAVAPSLENSFTLKIEGDEAAAPANPFYSNPYLVSSDSVAPSLSGVTVTPSITNGAGSIQVTALADDSQNGNTNIVEAAYCIDLGSFTNMNASDGAFDSSREALTADIPADVLSNLSAGTHTVYVKAKDAAGNWTNLVSVQFTIDRSLPRSEITDPLPLSWIRGSAYTVKGKVIKGANETANIETVQVSLDGGITWITARNTGVDFSTWDVIIDTTTLPDGLNRIISRARDVAGNVEIPGPGVYFYVDNSPPQAQIVAPGNGSVVDGTVDIVGKVQDLSLQDYKLEYAPQSQPDSWQSIQPASTFTSPVDCQTYTDDSNSDFNGALVKSNVDLTTFPGSVVLTKNYDTVNLVSSAVVTYSAGVYPSGSGNILADNNTSTYLYMYNYPQWIKFDFGSAKSLAKITLQFSGYPIPSFDYKVEVSNTGDFAGEQQALVTVTGNTSSTRTHFFEPVRARYLRIYFPNGQTSSYLYVTEVNINEGRYRGVSGTLESRVFDAGEVSFWKYLRVEGTQPANTGLAVKVRTGNTPTPDTSWSSWQEVFALNGDARIPSPSGRYLQYRLELTSGDDVSTPKVDKVTLVAASDVLARWDVSALAEGNYFLRLTARDNLGNTATHTVTVTVDRTAPTLSVDQPAEGAYVGARALVQGTAGDAGGIYCVEMAVDGGSWFQIDNRSNWSYFWDTTSLADGSTHTVAFRAVDKGGRYSPVVTRQVVIDNVLPTAAITYPAANGVSFRGTLTVKGNCNDSHFTRYRLELGAGTAPVSWSLLAEGYSPLLAETEIANVDTTALTSGSLYTLRLTVEDVAGNTTQVLRTFYADNTPPTANLYVENAGWNTWKLNFRGARYDNVKFVNWYLEYRRAGTGDPFTLITSGTSTDTSDYAGYYSGWDTTSLLEGNYEFRVRVQGAGIRRSRQRED